MLAATSYQGDPLFSHGLTWQVWVILLVKVIVVFVLLMISVLFMVMYERKAIARLGNRWGPNRAGPTVGCNRSPTASSCSSRRRSFLLERTSSYIKPRR